MEITYADMGKNEHRYQIFVASWSAQRGDPGYACNKDKCAGFDANGHDFGVWRHMFVAKCLDHVALVKEEAEYNQQRQDRVDSGSRRYEGHGCVMYAGIDGPRKPAYRQLDVCVLVDKHQEENAAGF